VDNSRVVQSISSHKDIVTCLALGVDGKTLITGSKDTTLNIWRINIKGNQHRVEDQPVHTLYGHNDEVTCVDISIELDISVSGSKDGTAIIHTLRKGIYVRSIYHPTGRPITKVCISGRRNLVLYSADDSSLRLYTVNGQLLLTAECSEPIHSMFITKQHSAHTSYLITGSHSSLQIRSLFDLRIVYSFPTDAPVREITMTSDEKHLLVGLQNGKLLIVSPAGHIQ